MPGPIPLRFIHWTDVVECELFGFVLIVMEMLENVGKIRRILAFSTPLQIRGSTLRIAKRQSISRQASRWTVHEREKLLHATLFGRRKTPSFVSLPRPLVVAGSSVESFRCPPRVRVLRVVSTADVKSPA